MNFYLNEAHQSTNTRRPPLQIVKTEEEYTEEQLPSHPCLKLVANSEQVLSKLTARRLLTYEKISEVKPNMHLDSNIGTHNFREKYFSMGEMTRRERKEKKAEEIATNMLGNMLNICNNT
ncbi:unnamed protein product, partial [Brenthis ino]